MHPILFEIAGIEFPSYYTLLTLAFGAGLYAAWTEAKRVGLDPDDVLDLGLLMVISGLVGARILHVFADCYFWDYVHLCTDPLLVEVPQFIHVHCETDAQCISAEAGGLCHPDTGRCHPERDCFAAFRFWSGGLAFLGGFVGAFAVGVYFVKKRAMPVLMSADLASMCVAVGLAIGRIGCFLSGCCYGAVSHGPWGVRFSGYVAKIRPDGSCPPHYDFLQTPDGPLCAFGRPAFLDQAKAGLLNHGTHQSLPVLPTQLMESTLAFGLFAWIWFWRRHHIRFPGHAMCDFILFYALGRFALEFFRADERGLWLGAILSTSQLIAIPLALAAGWRIWQGLRMAENG